jgi:hypothetical protein
MQEELLKKHKEENGALPIWNAKKKLVVKSKGPPAPPKRKKAPTPQTKAKTKVNTAASKTISKPKIAQVKRPTAKAETPAKIETPSKQETSTETAEKPKPSGSEMTT